MTYYERHLPHWQPEDAAIFITWRLHGSAPAQVNWIRKPPTGKAFVVLDRDLDKAATGPRWLLNEQVAQSVVDALKYGEKQLCLYDLEAWVLMANHVHILVQPKAALPKITKSIKGFSARQANAILERTGQPFWREESYDHWVRGPKETRKIFQYIENNPVTAGLVERPEDYRWSSAFAVPERQAGRPVAQ